MGRKQSKKKNVGKIISSWSVSSVGYPYQLPIVTLTFVVYPSEKKKRWPKAYISIDAKMTNCERFPRAARRSVHGTSWLPSPEHLTLPTPTAEVAGLLSVIAGLGR